MEVLFHFFNFLFARQPPCLFTRQKPWQITFNFLDNTTLHLRNSVLLTLLNNFFLFAHITHGCYVYLQK